VSTSHQDSQSEQNQSTQSGLDENIAGALAYVFGFLSGIVMYLVESENETVRFHAAQSIVVFGAFFIASLVVSVLQAVLVFGDVTAFVFGTIFGLIGFVLWIAAIILWIYLIIRTYQGSDPRIPIAAGIADGLV
jgi:uncharacterized membrane protein